MSLSFTIANNWSDHSKVRVPVPWQTGYGSNGICFEANYKEQEWMIRLNDFPDEPAFTLIIDQIEILHFDDWPEFWIRPEFPKTNWK